MNNNMLTGGGNAILKYRITSYNVCYTKLLRMILLMPQEKRKLVFTPKQAITIEQFEQALEVTHLRKAY